MVAAVLSKTTKVGGKGDHYKEVVIKDGHKPPSAYNMTSTTTKLPPGSLIKASPDSTTH